LERVSLQGTFEVLSLAEVLRSLASAHKTGVVSLDLGGGAGTIELRDGECIAARFDDRRDAHEAGANVRDRLIDLCFATLDEPRATFRFAAVEVSGSAAGIAVDSLLPDVERLAAEWEELRERIPSLAAVPVLAPALDGDTITLTGSQWAVLACCDGRRSVREIAPLGCSATIAACRTVLELIDRAAITLTEPVSAPREPVMPAVAPARVAPRDLLADEAMDAATSDDVISTPFGELIDEATSSADTADRLATMQVFSSLIDAPGDPGFGRADSRVATRVAHRR
jgi:hypothetical protein